MATPTVPPRSPALPLHRLDAETYGRMVSCGALEGEHVELLEGLLVDVSPHSPAHATAIRRLARHLATAPGCLQVQLPLEVPPDCVPEPDVALLAEEPSPGRHPRTALLVVEVAGSSHAVDRGLKAALYARANVPTYWLVDLPGRAVEVRTQPGPDGYGRCDVYRAGARVPEPAAGVEGLDVASLFE